MVILYVPFSLQKEMKFGFSMLRLYRGAICKLYHSSVNFAFTLHTAWLQDIGSRSTKYKISLKEDYEELAKNFQSHPEFEKEIEDLFAKELYPRLETE